VIDLKEIQSFTESDVELKVIYPLLTTPNPEGLGYFEYHIQTKHSIKKLTIDKGTSSKLYYPDLAIIIEGLPIIIIEAKKPNEDLSEAYRQACLYANEINREFPNKVNPCEFIIASDGLQLLAGYADSQPLCNIKYEDFNSTNFEFDKFLNSFSIKPILKNAKAKRTVLGTETRFKNPINLLGGKKIQNLESNNTFGENISIQYEHLFNPKLEVEKEDIARNAYVKQGRIESHIPPIDTIFERKLLSAKNKAKQEFEEPVKLLSKFNNHEELNNKVLRR
jgi:type I site-specific restriction-modification system R (restriction) subunit